MKLTPESDQDIPRSVIEKLRIYDLMLFGRIDAGQGLQDWGIELDPGAMKAPVIVEYLDFLTRHHPFLNDMNQETWKTRASFNVPGNPEWDHLIIDAKVAGKTLKREEARALLAGRFALGAPGSTTLSGTAERWLEIRRIGIDLNPVKDFLLDIERQTIEKEKLSLDQREKKLENLEKNGPSAENDEERYRIMIGKSAMVVAEASLDSETKKLSEAMARIASITESKRREIGLSQGLSPNASNFQHNVGRLYWGRLGIIKQNGLEGVKDSPGKTIVPAVYKEVMLPETDGLLRVQSNTMEGGAYLSGYVDLEGKTSIPCVFEEIGFFSEGLSAVRGTNKDGYKWGYIDRQGGLAIPFKYQEARPFSDGLAAVRDFHDQWGYIDPKGAEIIPCSFAYKVDRFSEGMAAVQANDGSSLWGIIDKGGKFLVPCTYKNISSFSEGLAAVGGDDNLWGYVDRTGALSISRIYSSAGNFSQGTAIAMDSKSRKWGIIDKTGKAIVDFKYEAIRAFTEGLAAVRDERKLWGYVNASGSQVIPPSFFKAGDFHGGLAAVIVREYPSKSLSSISAEDLNVKGYIDSSGKYAFAGRFMDVDDFSGEGYAIVSVAKSLSEVKKKKIGFGSCDFRALELEEFLIDRKGKSMEGIAGKPVRKQRDVPK
jgi:hypothetical protein